METEKEKRLQADCYALSEKLDAANKRADYWESVGKAEESRRMDCQEREATLRGEMERLRMFALRAGHLDECDKCQIHPKGMNPKCSCGMDAALVREAR